MKHAWFSKTQMRVCHGMDLIGGTTFPVYLRVSDGAEVVVTEVSRSDKYSSNFNDVQYLGIVSHCTRFQEFPVPVDNPNRDLPQEMDWSQYQRDPAGAEVTADMFIWDF